MDKLIATLALSSSISASSLCNSNEANLKCQACINTHPSCQWCEKLDLNSTFPRCQSSEFWSSNAELCTLPFPNKNNRKSLLQGKLTKLSYAQNNPYKSSKNSDKIVQMRPQKVIARLRKGETKQIEISFKLADDYPVDLYYLMDLSQSMSDDLGTLKTQGIAIGQALQKFSSSVRIGFGSFVDKPVMPFVNTLPEKLANPCTASKPCDPPYLFKNTHSLSSDFAAFQRNLNKTRVSSNLDAPEGGMEAMMQAIVCSDEIGWRVGTKDSPAATKLLVYSSDAGFHTAGDGKLAGIVIPNDMQCHMKNGEYTHAKVHDYPSLGQIRYKLNEHDIQPIFAVTEQHQSIYKAVADLISDRSYVGELKNDSSNIRELVSKAYNSLRGKVVIEPKIQADFLDKVLLSTGESMCDPQTGIWTEGLKCDNVQLSKEIKFRVKITAEDCFTDASTTVKFIARGYDDTTEVHLTTECECDCSEKVNDDEIFNFDRKCSGNGRFNCGICECDPGHGGDKCQCDITSVEDYKIHEQKCRRPGSLQICSGRGECVCGECKCNSDSDGKKYEGKHCHCDNVSCPRKGGVLCNGQGTCSCGVCQCNSMFTGDDCSCTLKTDTCVYNGELSGSGMVCAGNGDCKCGRCHCPSLDDTLNSYSVSGKHCESPSLHNCAMHNQCVLRYYRNQTEAIEIYDDDTENEKYRCTDEKFKMYEFIKVQRMSDEQRERRCRAQFTERDGSKDDCWISYFSSLSETTVLVNEKYLKKVKIIYEEFNEKDHCPLKINKTTMMGIIAGSIILFGLLLIFLWKIFMWYLDYKDYQKFKMDINADKHFSEVNPLYESATKTTKNPLLK